MNKDLNITEEEYKQIASEEKLPVKLNKKNLGNVIYIKYYFKQNI